MRCGWLRWGGLALVLAMAGCGGGGDSTETTVSGSGLNALGLSPAVSLSEDPANPTKQTPVTTNVTVPTTGNPDPTDTSGLPNTLRVVVEDGPHGFQFSANANILYATVTVCKPNTTPAVCQEIDHVQVDTGSVGLRVLASKVRSLNLDPVLLSGTDPTWECYPFVIGGLWGQTAMANVTLGPQTTTSPIPIQMIEDDPNAAIQATSGCQTATDNHILSSAAALGSNGILGIGATDIDCGYSCIAGDYTGTYVQYYNCNAATTPICSAAPAMGANYLTRNPVDALPTPYNNGVVLKMPAVTNPGAATATGVLILGVGTVANNMVPGNAQRVYLGTDYTNHPDSYLRATTRFNGVDFLDSYLDTGTNGLFFTDSSITRCTANVWYCPASVLNVSATISDGDNPTLNPVGVNFQIGNAEALFSTNNTAFSGAAGPTPPPTSSAPATTAKTFAWGMPFFYGRKVYLTVSRLNTTHNPSANTPPLSPPPWNAWAPL